MARTLYADLDLLQNALRGAVLDDRASAPANGKVGQVYFNTGDSTLYYFADSDGDGTGAWIPLSTGGSLDEAIEAVQDALDDKADKATKIIAGSGLSIEGANDTLGGDVEIVVDRGRGIDVDLNNGITVKIGSGLQWGGVGADEVTLDSAIVDELGRLNSADLTEQAAREAADADLYDIKADKSTQVIAGTGLANAGNDNLGADITLTVDEDWLVQQIEDNAANNLAAGNGIAITDGGGAGAADTVAVRISTDVGVDNGLSFGADGGLYAADLTDNLATERTERIEADANISTRIGAEETARADADAALDGRVSAVENDIITSANAALTAKEDTNGDTLLTVVVDAVQGGNQLSIGPDGLFVPTPTAATVTSVTGTAGEVEVTPTGTVFQVGLEDAITTAISDNTAAIAQETADRTAADTALGVRIDGVQEDLTDEINARLLGDNTMQNLLDAEVTARQGADTALGGRIDALDITGTGMVTVTETALNSGVWTVDVPSLQLANTYTGDSGVDSDTINADIAPAVGQPGDLYINTSDGRAFINTGVAAPNDWVALAAAEVGVDSIASGDNSITVTNGAGPNADVAVSAALQTAISDSTTKNTAQDARLDGIDAAQGVQDGRLDGIDAAQGVQDGRLDTIEGVNAAQDTAITGLQNTKADKAVTVTAGDGLVGGGTLAGPDVPLSVQVGFGLGVDANGVWVDSGVGIESDANGVSVKYGDGLAIGGDGDSLVVKPADNSILVDGSGVRVAPAARRFTAPLGNVATTQTFTHPLGTGAVVVAIYDGGGTEIWADVKVVNGTTVEVTTTPAVAGYVVIQA